jgi:3-deoxy-7-phosphoheptulonate synthase
LDISAVPVAQQLSHLPVIVDPSHASGHRELVVPLSRAAIAVGADGLIVDLHPEPGRALCDGNQALTEANLRDLASAVAELPRLLGRELVPALGNLREEPAYADGTRAVLSRSMTSA